ncbi:unnamed protein product [Onchocerca flexuosa]|uniref:Wsv136 n=1 Tax=Onchocerca flexuosa TaxID=387005 RepID=A0A183HUI6_9BILA|nr:unnamed protein product [Onchocerca flexuosa]
MGLSSGQLCLFAIKKEVSSLLQHGNLRSLSLTYNSFDSVENDDQLVRVERNNQNNNDDSITTVTTVADINMSKKREAFIIDDGSIHLVTNKVIVYIITIVFVWNLVQIWKFFRI